MDLKELKAFRTIIEEGTFSKAAEKLHYAQSTITNQIQRLEKELGIQLFKRGWDAELTEAGKIYAKEVEMLINHWNLVAEKAANLQKEEIGNIYIGITEVLTEKVLPNAIKKFSDYKPKVGCHFIIGNTDTLSKTLIADDSLDFVCSGEPTDMTGLHFDSLYQEEISFIVSSKHLLSQKEHLELMDILSYPFVTGGSSCLYRLQLEREFSAHLATPFFHSVSQISAIPAIIKQTDFIGVVLLSTSLPDGVVKIPVKLENPFLPIGILSRRNVKYISQSRQLFLNCLKEEITNVYLG
jgi:LysR family transcriptional regulator, regulator of the ytmI operon